jgi:hypothetical protein
MPDHCCDTMRFQCRTHWQDQPEDEKPDASIEYNPATGFYTISNSNGLFRCAINYCPWCATALPPKPEIASAIERAIQNQNQR